MATANMLMVTSASGPSKWAPRMRRVPSSMRTLNPEPLSLDPRRLEIEIVELGNAPAAVDDHVGVEPALLAPRHAPHRELTAAVVDPVHVRRDLDTDADLARPLHQQIHQVGIEALERTRATVQDRHARAGPSGHVGELEGDISATDKDEARRQRVELKKLLACGETLGTGEPHRRRH